jgi:hypothetical protein
VPQAPRGDAVAFEGDGRSDSRGERGGFGGGDRRGGERSFGGGGERSFAPRRPTGDRRDFGERRERSNNVNEERPGDWCVCHCVCARAMLAAKAKADSLLCPARLRPCQCGFRNFASRSECFKCHAPR